MTRGYQNVIRNIASMPARKEAAALALAKAYGMQCGLYAQQNRRWTDRTSHAKQGLHGDATIVANGIRVFAAHFEPYGVYLELCHQGRYSILEESLESEIGVFWKQMFIMMNTPI